MELSADALLLTHDAPAHDAPTPPRSPPRRPRPAWPMWLSSRVGAAEAALATVFVGGAALAASPRRDRPPAPDPDDEVLPPIPDPAASLDLSLADAWAAVRRAAAAALASFDDTGGGSEEHVRDGSEDVCGATERDKGASEDLRAPQGELSAKEQCFDGRDGARERAHLSICDGDKVAAHDSACGPDASGGSSGEDVHAKLAQLTVCDSADSSSQAASAPYRHALEGVEFSEITASSSFGDGFSRSHRSVSSCGDEFREVNEGTGTDQTGAHSVDAISDELASADEYQESAEVGSDCTEQSESQETRSSVLKECPDVQTVESALQPLKEGRSADLAALRKQFNLMFEQNGGADCIAHVKQIGDDALAGMRDSASMGEKVMAELNDAKIILDDALCRLDTAVRSKVNERHPEYADAASAAESVIAESKENMESGQEEESQDSGGDLVADASRLLAVFATKVCASTLECIERSRGERSWSERVENVAEIGILGVSQLRAVSSKFASAIKRLRGAVKDKADETCPAEMKMLDEAAVGYVLQCIALGIAALQIEAAERAYTNSNK